VKVRIQKDGGEEILAYLFPDRAWLERAMTEGQHFFRMEELAPQAKSCKLSF